MSREDRIQLGVLTVLAMLLPIAVSIPLDLPLWATLLIIAVALIGVLGRAVQLHQREPARWQPPAQIPTQPPTPPSEFRLADIPLPSSDPDHRFRFTCRVLWRQLPNSSGWPNVNPSALAAESVLARAREVTTRHQPADCPVAAHSLAAGLGRVTRDQTGQVEAWAVDVTLALTPEDDQRLAKLAELRKNESLWEQERAFERSLRRYLAEEALATPSSAVVWWLARHLDQVEQAVQLRDALAKLSAIAREDEAGAPAAARALDGRWTPPEADREPMLPVQASAPAEESRS